MDVNNFSFEKVEIKVENYDEDPLDNDTADGYECQKIEESSIDVDKVKIEPVYLTIPHENIYVEPDRQDLRSYLNQSFKGLLILNYYKLHNNLTDTLSNYLAEIAVGRVIHNILKRQKITTENPLKKLIVPTVILKNLATEISLLFNEKSGIYYTPGLTDGTKKINAGGKLQSQLNYARRLLIDSGLLVISNRRSSVLTDSTDSASSSSLLNLLKKESEDLEQIEKAWIDAFAARRQMVADSSDKLVEFNLYPCLSGDKATHFITLDFERKFEGAKSLKTSWPDLRATFEDFILSKRIDDVDAAAQVANLAELVDADKDAVIISLLPLAIKSSVSSTAKRRKVENNPVVDGKLTELKNSYILTVEKSEELEDKIKTRWQTFITNKEAFYPFMVFVGPVCKPVDFYVVIGNTKLKVYTALEALDVTFKIFLTTSCPFPKFAGLTYILLKKVVYQITSPTKSSIQLERALSFFEKKLNTTFN
ncbi:uncharacterized protein LOC123265838 isoform X1 [Cotesia glomerata]|uniref:Uncharacterized protein n=1 Tax=Cotesia glomerata TaxID=32391 RepID=A0AAV7IY00_COTGL|nr:uncharacterized protein LOC123265838 isoform X1 [Cotesia glomerata]KAH0561717.1 hypothetical protein KQX54_018993 [Cotesia glomerata]